MYQKLLFRFPGYLFYLDLKASSSILIWISEWCYSDRGTCGKVGNFLHGIILEKTFVSGLAALPENFTLQNLWR